MGGQLSTSCEMAASRQRRKPGEEDIVGIRYQATASEDREDLVRAVVKGELVKVL